MFRIPYEKIRNLVASDTLEGHDISKIINEVCTERPLDTYQAAVILRRLRKDPSFLSTLTNRAFDIKRENFGNNIKLFVPLYISNRCENDCAYCAYRRGHVNMPRKTLNEEEFRRELSAVMDKGYRVIELVTSESTELKNNNSLAHYVKIAREMLDSQDQKEGKGEIILMSWALSDDEFAIVKDAGIDAFYLWQETYNPDIYSDMHPAGTPKNDFQWRVGVFDRAIRAGIRRVGLGILLGLAPWEFDVLALIEHGKYLEEKYNVTLDVIGVPRFKKAQGIKISAAPHPVSDAQLKAAVAIYRMAFPRTHIFLNTREKLSLIFELLQCGGSEMNIACAVFPGGYTEFIPDRQFDYYSYPTEKTVTLLQSKGYQPTHFKCKVIKEI